MKVQVPGDDELHKIVKVVYDDKSKVANLYEFVAAGIEWANEQLATTPPTKRPFLSDGEIDDEANRVYGPAYVFPYTVGARWARDKYEAAFGGVVPVNFELNHVLALLEDIKVAVETNRTDGTFDYIERTVRMAQAELVKNRIAPQPKKVLRRWVEIFQIESKHPERTFGSLGVIALAKDNLDRMVGKTREEIPGSETFPDEWFTEAKG